MEKRITDLLSEVVAINSINPTLGGGPGESEIANFICQHLIKIGLDAELYSVGAARANVVAVARGKDRRGSLVLNGHIDTVGVEGMPAPFTLRQEGDRLYGRGIYDMKGGVAVMLALAECFSNHPAGRQRLVDVFGRRGGPQPRHRTARARLAPDRRTEAGGGCLSRTHGGGNRGFPQGLHLV